MTIETIREEGLLFFEGISGSMAYGLDTAESDTDIKGVFVLPKDRFFGLDYVPQIANETNDVVHYELKRFFELLVKNNPNILELLFLPEECVLHRHPLFERVKPESFMSKLCRETFAGYAASQMKRARGLKKKIMNPAAGERKSILDFCRVILGARSVGLTGWLARKGVDQKQCGLAAVSRVKNTYALFIDRSGKNGYEGVSKHERSQDVSLSSIPKGLKPVNIDGYSRSCREYQEYKEWVNHRNAARYRNTLSHGKNYDAKNMMHTFRLLDIAEEIARTGRFSVRRPNRDELLAIKEGKFEYEELMDRANAKLESINALFDKSALPEKPSEEKAAQLLAEIRDHIYKHQPSPGRGNH